MRHCNILFAMLVGVAQALVPALAVPGSSAAPASDASATASAAKAAEPGPHIAVLLPLKSRSLGAAAQAVRDGVQAAAGSNSNETGKPPLPVVVYTIGDKESDVLAGYDMAVSQQARVVIGPLGRSPVQALVRGGPARLPTIVLSAVDSEPAPVGPWYTLTLSVDLEARQAAQLAWRNGGRTAVTIQTDPVFGQRIQTAFADEWQRLGGQLLASVALKPTPAELKALKQNVSQAGTPDVIFLATDARAAKQLRPWLDTAIVTYATSQAYDGLPTQPSNMDLIRVRFVDAPWLVQPDYFSAVGYTRPQKAMRADLARFYALGIDAWRLAQWLAIGTLRPGFDFDGTTGQLRLDERGVFQRTPLAAEIGNEGPVVLP